MGCCLKSSDGYELKFEESHVLDDFNQDERHPDSFKDISISSDTSYQENTEFSSRNSNQLTNDIEAAFLWNSPRFSCGSSKFLTKFRETETIVDTEEAEAQEVSFKFDVRHIQ